ncbi:isochorismatase family protein [Actinokineospora iranica]|uniref:Bifunctional isochorismate lyase / aryl carrier protein n=1 Tax=Actinokineospora iranica TaxID=1271860 RepID=A0A1G6RSJ3_9PSEU|nr:isochorismatase family protein [Actinokineospora iranica]SDD07589.1 bifunctional isochorismate lyase / aryl carrier protein [Actinokineospora iranica]
MSRPVVDPYDMSDAARLPRAAVEWVAAAGRAVLLVHDMGDDKVCAFDAGSSPMVELAHNVGKLRDTCRDLRVPVAESVREGVSVFTTVTGLGPDKTLTGDHYARLRDLLDEAGRDQLIVTGIRAHAACLMAAAGTHLAGIEVFCVADAIADLSLDEHRRAVLSAAEYGAMPTTAGRVIGQLLGVLA